MRALTAVAAGLALAVLGLVVVHLATARALPGRPAAGPGGHSPHGGAAAPGRSGSRTAGAPASERSGTLGRYWVGGAWYRFTEPARIGPSGRPLAPRSLRTQLWYPVAGRPDRRSARPAKGPFPLIVFGPGFRQCGSPYAHLLRAWASAGYVVAVVNFPRSDCLAGSAATEADLVNQPGDITFEVTRLLAASATRRGLLGGLISRSRVAVAGQSDGGDAVAAATAASCCADRRIKAAAVLSGAEWPPMPGRYFARRPPPMLFVQGSADAINPPAASLQLYRADPARARYYLDLFGVGHMTPYVGGGLAERITTRVTLAFFDRWVLGQRPAARAIVADGTVPGVSALVKAGVLPPR